MTEARTEDVAILRGVWSELRRDRDVGETEVGVSVEHGVVTLSGTVSSWGKSIAAERAAHRAAGVLDVANDLRILIAGSSELTARDIARAVRGALAQRTSLAHEQIESTVNHGVVAIEGRVRSYLERDEAEQAVRALQGVTRVVNKLRIEP
jgi:osmotically-inducible protein OsmY